MQPKPQLFAKVGGWLKWELDVTTVSILADYITSFLRKESMNQESTLAALRAYVPSGVDDAEFRDRMVDFVERYPADFHRRTTVEGHLTASAWIVNAQHDRFLLCHHSKLNRWLQLGGHIEEDPNLAAAALREAKEESGLDSVRLASEEVFDVDIHTIPARKGEPEHLHLDVRFLIVADEEETLEISEESNDLAWVSADTLRKELPEASMLRMLEKTPAP